jgi:hypothetical protein
MEGYRVRMNNPVALVTENNKELLKVGGKISILWIFQKGVHLEILQCFCTPTNFTGRSGCNLDSLRLHRML